MELQIPDTVVRALRIPEPDMPARLRTELAVTLYAQRVLAFGAARELASMSVAAFSQLLGTRGVPRHYTAEELEDDIAYARRQ